MDKKEIIKEAVEEIITTIEKEIGNSNNSHYFCEDESVIITDVGYVLEWFDEYKEILRKKYCK